MKRAHHAGIVIGSVSAAAAALTAAAPAQAARAPDWQIMAMVHYGIGANASGYSAVVAPGKNDAWVFGGTNPGGTSAPAAEHWGGSRWRRAPLVGHEHLGGRQRVRAALERREVGGREDLEAAR